MSRSEQIEFIKQQTKLAKKIAIRPHIAESEVLAALHDLDKNTPQGAHNMRRDHTAVSKE